MKYTDNLNLSLYEAADKMNITGETDSLNHNMELIDEAIAKTALTVSQDEEGNVLVTRGDDEFVVDATLDQQSTNPIQNKAVFEAIENIRGGSSEPSGTSESWHFVGEATSDGVTNLFVPLGDYKNAKKIYAYARYSKAPTADGAYSSWCIDSSWVKTLCRSQVVRSNINIERETYFIIAERINEDIMLCISSSSDVKTLINGVSHAETGWLVNLSEMNRIEFKEITSIPSVDGITLKVYAYM